MLLISLYTSWKHVAFLPENVGKLKVFWRFQGVQKLGFGVKKVFLAIVFHNSARLNNNLYYINLYNLYAIAVSWAKWVGKKYKFPDW